MVRYDLTGQRFGRLTVIRRVESRPNRHEARWECLCDCGNIHYAETYQLTHGVCKSCGCYRKEVTAELKKSHGQAGTRIYGIYKGIHSRCYNKNFKAYPRYGGRGIKMCNEWRNDFQAFHDWAMTHGYRDDLTIDRIDNDGDYCPENCRWVSMKIQANNTRRNVIAEYNGEAHTAAEWEDLYGLKQGYVAGALRRGWSIEEILTGKIPKVESRGRLYEINGEFHTQAEWIRMSDIGEDAVYGRLHRGWDLERAITEPLKWGAHVKKDNL